jgi:hypothetical protein
LSLAIADLDADGDADLAVVNGSDDNVSILLNQGDGTFAPDVIYGAGDQPRSVAIGDLDGDWDADLAVANAYGAGTVSILLNQTGDCNDNGIPDECDIDCGPPGGPCDLPRCGQSEDCNENDIPDECDIDDGTSEDDNNNGVPDECEIAAYLDIKPGSCPNPVNPRSKGVVPTAIVGSESFDVTQIDIDTLTLSRTDGVGRVVTPLTGPPGPGTRVEDVATPFAGDPCDCHDLTGDGMDDLLLKFSTPELAGAFDLGTLPGGTSVMLTLTGSLLDGTTFVAADCIVIPGRRAPASLRSSRRPK